MSDQQVAPTLIACPACAADVSNRAASCPKCGQPVAAPNPDKWKEVRGQLLMAVVTITVTAMTLIFTWQREAALKEYEVTFKMKQEVYASFMRSLTEAFDSARVNRDADEMWRSLRSAKTSYFGMEPFVGDAGRRRLVNAHLAEYTEFCKVVAMEQGVSADEKNRRFSEQLDRFREELYPALFPR